MQLVGGADKLSAAIQAIAVGRRPGGRCLGRPGRGRYDRAAAAGAGGLDHPGHHGGASGYLVGGMTYTTAQSINETRRLADEQQQATFEYLKNKEEELRVLREIGREEDGGGEP